MAEPGDLGASTASTADLEERLARAEARAAAAEERAAAYEARALRALEVNQLRESMFALWHGDDGRALGARGAIAAPRSSAAAAARARHAQRGGGAGGGGDG